MKEMEYDYLKKKCGILSLKYVVLCKSLSFFPKADCLSRVYVFCDVVLI